VILVGLAVIMPWLLRNSFRFRLYNASWRGTRFHFRGSLGGAYRVFLLNFFLSVITLYVLAPFAHQRLKAWQHGNRWFGNTQFSFHARAGQFYKLYLLLLASMVLFIVIFLVSGAGSTFVAISMAQKTGQRVDPQAVFRLLAVLYGTLILLSILVGSVFHA